MTAQQDPARPAAPGPRSGLPVIRGRQDTLDGVRAVAALAVLVFHVAANAGTDRTHAGRLFNSGQIGVAIFFTLSGLLLYRPWAAALLNGRTTPRTRTYLRKRALRILPAYWALVICVMLTAERDRLDDGCAWTRLLTLTHVYDACEPWSSGLEPAQLGQAWSLAVEVAWYVTLPMTASALAWYARGRAPARPRRVDDVTRRARRLLRGLALYAMVSFGYTVAVCVPHRHVIAASWPPRFLAWFAAGMALAVVAAWANAEPGGAAARFSRTIAASWGTCWLAAAFLFVICASPVTGDPRLGIFDAAWTAQFHILGYGACAAFFVAPVALAPPGHPGLTTVLANRTMRFLGRVSYGIFLWQMIIILGWYNVTDRLFHGRLLVDLPLLAAATVLAATMSYHLLERPVQMLSNRLPDGPPNRPSGRRTAPSRS